MKSIGPRACLTILVLAVQACGGRAREEVDIPRLVIPEPEIRQPRGEPHPRPPNMADAPVLAHFTLLPELINRAHVTTMVRSLYPSALREAGVGGRAMVWLLIDESGHVLKSQIHTTSGREEFDDAALRVSMEMEFKAAEDHGQVVMVWIALPIVFERDAE